MDLNYLVITNGQVIRLNKGPLSSFTYNFKSDILNYLEFNEEFPIKNEIRGLNFKFSRYNPFSHSMVPYSEEENFMFIARCAWGATI